MFYLYTVGICLLQELMKAREAPLPPLQKVETIPDLFTSESYGSQVIHTKEGNLLFKTAEGEEVWMAEELFRDAAERGEGFGIDEWTPEGYLNRIFFQKSTSFVVRSGNGDVAGAGLYGPSSLSRTPSPHLAHCYITINPKYKNLGIAKSMFQFFIDTAKKENYSHFMVDAPMTDHVMTKMLYQNKFRVRGSFPDCLYMKDVGPMHNNLFSKKLVDFPGVKTPNEYLQI